MAGRTRLRRAGDQDPSPTDRSHPYSNNLTDSDRWPVVALALLFLAAIIVGWQRWTHPVVDHPREMNIPVRLLSGERLYIDILYYYGPIAPYLLAGLFRLFGIHLWVVHALGLLCAALSLSLLYRLARFLLQPWDAAIATALILVTCAFSANLGTYVQPYAYAALLAWVFSLGSLVATCEYITAGRARSLLVAGLCAGAAAACKPEYGLVAGTPAALVWALKAWVTGRWQLRSGLWLVLPCVAVTGLTWLPVVLAVPWETLVTDNVKLFSQPQMVFFSRHLSGSRAWPATGFALIAGLGMLLGACGVTTVLSTLDKRWPIALRPQARGWWAVAAGVACLVAIGWVPDYIDVTPVRGTPIVLTALLIGGVVHLRRHGAIADAPRDALYVVALSAFGLLAAMRVILNVSLQTPYTLFTVPLSIVLCCYVFLQLSPRLLSVDAAARRRAGMLGRCVLAGILGWEAVDQAELLRARNDTPIRAPRGTMLTNAVYAQPFAEAIRYVKDRTHPNEPVVCLPQCSLVHFLAERPNPLRQESVVPGFVTPDQEDEVSRRIANRNVRTILVANVLTSEYRDVGFGRDYNTRLMAWILENYREDATFASTPRAGLAFGDPAFFIRAYVRQGAPLE